MLLRISSSSLPSWVPSNDHRRSMQRSSDGGMGGSFSPGQVNLESCINIETPRFKFLDEADEIFEKRFIYYIYNTFMDRLAVAIQSASSSIFRRSSLDSLLTQPTGVRAFSFPCGNLFCLVCMHFSSTKWSGVCRAGVCMPAV